jgi:hypothetical protein
MSGSEKSDRTLGMAKSDIEDWRMEKEKETNARRGK